MTHATRTDYDRAMTLLRDHAGDLRPSEASAAHDCTYSYTCNEPGFISRSAEIVGRAYAGLVLGTIDRA